MNILFVCTGNTCRSPMAEALLKDRLAQRNCGEKIHVLSAGLSAVDGDPISRGAKRALSELGLESSEHLAVRVTPELLHEADLILTMTDFHRRMVLALFPQLQPKLFTFADFLNANAGTMNADADEKRVFGEVVDPYGGPDEVYALCAAQLNTMTAVLTDLLCEPPNRSAGDGSV